MTVTPAQTNRSRIASPNRQRHPRAGYLLPLRPLQPLRRELTISMTSMALIASPAASEEDPFDVGLDALMSSDAVPAIPISSTSPTLLTTPNTHPTASRIPPNPMRLHQSSPFAGTLNHDPSHPPLHSHSNGSVLPRPLPPSQGTTRLLQTESTAWLLPGPRETAVAPAAESMGSAPMLALPLRAPPPREAAMAAHPAALPTPEAPGEPRPSYVDVGHLRRLSNASSARSEVSPRKGIWGWGRERLRIA
jgi:hypothetical protein